MDSRASNDNGKRVQDAELAEGDCQHVDFICSDLGGLKKCWEGLTHQEKVEFRRDYGGIEDLIDCSVDKNAIRAFVSCFNTKLRCFVLPNMDLTITLEEYHFLTSCFWEARKEVYVPSLGKGKGMGPKQELESHFGVNNRWFSKVLRESKEEVLIDWQRAYEIMVQSESGPSKKKEKTHDISKKRRNFLALGIYGLILFPKTPNVVDSRVMKLIIEEGPSGKKTVMHAVLAETIRTCIRVRERRRGPLTCCAQLFTLWIYAHFPTAQSASVGSFGSLGPTISSKYGRPNMRYASREEWDKFLSQVDTDAVTWQVPWLTRSKEKFLKPPTGHAWIPLFGLKGVVSYSPFLVMRQLGNEQKEPAIGGYGRVDLLYDTQPQTIVEMDTLKGIWDGCAPDDVIPSTQCCEQYEEWRSKRADGKVRFKKPKPTIHNAYIDTKERLVLYKQRCRIAEEKELQLEVDLRGANENRKELKKVKEERDEAINEVEKVTGKAEADIWELKTKDRRFNVHLKQKSRLADKLMRTVPEQDQYIKQLEAECEGLRENEEIWQGKVEWLQKKREEDKEMMDANAEELRQAKKEIDLYKLANRMQALRREASEDCKNDPILNMKGFSSAIEQDDEVRAILRRQEGLAPYVDEVIGYLAGRLVWVDILGDTEGFWLDAEKRIADLRKSNKEFHA